MRRDIFAKPILYYSIALSASVWLGESLFHYWVFDPLHPFEIIPSDHNELWMRLLLCGIIILFGVYIQIQSNKKKALEEEKLNTLKATMHTVEDQVGNALLSIKFILLDAEKHHIINLELSSEILKLIDTTFQQLREIRKLEVVKESRFHKDTFYLDTNRS